MTMIAVWLKIDEECVVQGLEQAGEKLDSVEGEVALDFSSVRRINPGAIEALSEIASRADAESVKVVLRGVNFEVYKVLKLVKLASRFSFVS